MSPDGGSHNLPSSELEDFLGPFIDEGNQTVFISGNKTVMAELEDLVIILIVHELFSKSVVL